MKNSALPPTPYQYGYVEFDGRGDFLRTRDLDILEFDNQFTDNFSIEVKIKITRPFSPQRILGKYYGSGWIMGYHTSEWGFISIYLTGAGWKNIYYLGSDTSWHTFEAVYDKQSQSLRTFADGNLTFEYTNYLYGSLQNNGAFSVGNAGLLPLTGNQSVNLSSNWLSGCIDDLRIDVNQTAALNYNFNEGAGQFARDSSSFFKADRTYPQEEGCGTAHLMLGFNPAADTCDPLWITEDESPATKFRSLGTGFQNWHSGPDGEYFTEHFSLGMTVWNGNLINCGKFNRAGGTEANHIAKWNGNSWSPLGLGLNHEPVCLASYQNELYAAGYFDTAYGAGETKYIARWNGNSWRPLAEGLENLGTVMTVFNGELIVGGFFMSAGNNYSPRIARWNGSQWMPMGGGMSGPVWALCQFNGSLYAGGNFLYAGTEVCNGIAKWDGSGWQPAGTGVSGGNSSVFVLKVYNGELYAGGEFINMNQTLCYNIARYDGITWYPVGSGVKGSDCIPSMGQLRDMEIYNNELYIAGQFTKVDEVPANKIAKWNGTSWCGIEYGIDLRPEDLEVYQGELIINGGFYSISGKEFSNIAKYNPNPVLTGTINNHTGADGCILYQNYPNPFNPATVIRFEIPEGSDVSLKIYNILGGEIEILAEGYRNRGSYDVSFNGSNLPSGVYFYKLVAGGFAESRKMLLVK
jgi:hypothetical protein